MFTPRRWIAVTALLAFLFVITAPALAVARQAVDPLAYAGICRIDTGAGADTATGAPGSLQGKLKSAHCILCVATASLPPVIVISPVVVATVPELLLPVDRRPQAARDTAAFQPLHPRAPPRA